MKTKIQKFWLAGSVGVAAMAAALAGCPETTEDGGGGESGPNCVVAEACCALDPAQGENGAADCVGDDFEGDDWGGDADLDGSGMENDDGVLKLKPSTVTRVPVLWVSSTNENKIAKYDSVTGAELLRVPTWGRFPNRTAVASDGSVWITNRDSYHVIHLGADGAPLCATDYMNAGFGTGYTGPSCYSRAAAMDARGNAWIGCNDTGDVIQFSGTETDGTVALTDPNGIEAGIEVPKCKELARVNLPRVRPYGLAADRDGNLWVGVLGGGPVAKIDITDPTTPVATEFNIQSDPVLTAAGGCWNMYGMAIDLDGNPWWANLGCNTVVKQDGRTGAVLGVFTGGPDGLQGPRAAGLDRQGNLWFADNSSGFVDRFGADGTWLSRVDLGAGCGLGTPSYPGTLGTGSDIDGNMWTVLQNVGKVVKYTVDGEVIGCYPEETPATPLLASPYTYSDLTGSTNDLVTSSLGRWRGRVDQGQTLDWLLVSFRAAIPDGASVCVRVRAGEAADIDSASWSEAGCYTTGTPTEFTTYTIPDSIPNAGLLDVELQLSSRTQGVTPAVANLSVGARVP